MTRLKLVDLNEDPQNYKREKIEFGLAPHKY
jgi:hypothetical protein